MSAVSLLVLQIVLALIAAIGIPLFLFSYLKGERANNHRRQTKAAGSAGSPGRDSSIQWTDSDCRSAQLAGIVQSATGGEGNGQARMTTINMGSALRG